MQTDWMKKSFSGQISVAMLMLISFIWGCQQKDGTVAAPQTITDRILEDDQFSLFRTAMIYAGVGDALKDGNLTLFAPNDAAFQSSGITSSAAIQAMPREQVRSLVLYHLLSGQIAASTIPVGLNSVQTASRGTAFFNRTTDGSIFINNARLIQTDITTANGYIHVLGRVLNPSTGSLLTTIQNNPDLTYLSAAIKRVSASNPALLGSLTSTTATSAVTVFAPNDAAFKADKTYNSLTAIESANVQSLANLLLYHVVPGALFSNQIQTGSLSTLYNGNRINVVVTSNQFVVRGNKNTTLAIVKQADLPTTNGVMHIIDQVLQP